jgi:hypothetical protein
LSYCRDRNGQETEVLEMRGIGGRLRRGVRREDGQTTPEYVILLGAVVAFVATITVALTSFGGPLGDLLRSLFS